MKIQQKLIFAIAAIIFAALQPARANSQGASAPSDLHVAYGLQPAAQDANETSQEEEARPVMSKLLPDFPGKEVVIMTVTYPPGHSGAVHRHNAHGFIYVLEGSVVMAVNGGVPVTVATGQTFYEVPNDIHTVGRNASKTRPAKFLVLLIKDKDALISVPLK